MFQKDLWRKSKHTLCAQYFFRGRGGWGGVRNRAIYEIMSKNIAEPDRPQMTIWRMRIACQITKATNTNSVYVILIELPMQQRFTKSSLCQQSRYRPGGAQTVPGR